jgi:hypothetical protein
MTCSLHSSDCLYHWWQVPCHDMQQVQAPWSTTPELKAQGLSCRFFINIQSLDFFLDHTL